MPQSKSGSEAKRDKPRTPKPRDGDSVYIVQRVLQFQYGSSQSFNVALYGRQEDAIAKAEELDEAMSGLLQVELGTTGRTVGDTLAMIGVSGMEHLVFPTKFHVEKRIITPPLIIAP